jgi:DNA primase
LAVKAGVELKRQTRESAQMKTERQRLYEACELAARFFEKQLASSKTGAAAKKYLLDRGFSEKSIAAWRLGWAPSSWQGLHDFLASQGYTDKEIVGAGLAAASAGGRVYDRFRGRLMFPIENIFGEIVAFGGRILEAGEPKYLNSPETPVYTKGKNLYGLNKAKDAIRQSGFCLMVEGYFDALSLWNAGVRNVVATLGTALTRDHLELLRRYTQNVVALFDPDAAGLKALDRSLELFLGANMHARALILPEGCDPDDYIKKYGREKLDELIAVAPAISDYYIDNVLGDGTTFEENRDLVKTAMEFINKINDEIEKNLFIKRIAEKLGIDQTLLKREVYRKATYGQAGVAVRKESSKIKMNPLEFNLIRLMLEYPQKTLLVESEKILDYFLEPALKRLGEKIIENYKLLGYVDINVILPSDEDKPLRESIYKLSMEAPPTDDHMVERNFADNIQRIREKWYKEQKRLIQLQLRQAQESGNGELTRELTCQKQNVMKEEKEYVQKQ